MKQQIFMNITVLIFTISTVTGFWWGSSSKQAEEDEPVKRIPVHVLRTLTYHPVLIPNNPVPPIQYGRGFLSQYQGNLHQNSNPPMNNPYAASSNNYNTYQTNPPPPSPSTTTSSTTTTTTEATTTSTSPSTTIETTTYQLPPQDQFPQMTGKFASKTPIMSDRFGSGPGMNPYEYASNFGAQQMAAAAKGPQDPYNLQYVTNIAPMNVQFVPCMCPVEVRINPSDQHPTYVDNKSSEDSLLETNMNDLEDSLE